MADKTQIEWTKDPATGAKGATWNPIRAIDPETGDRKGWACDKVSPACANCYAESVNNRWGNQRPYLPGQHAQPALAADDLLLQPLAWKRPRRVFVCSMTDLFWEAVDDEWIDDVFHVMARAHQHTFLVLTKRAERMERWVNAWLDDHDLSGLPPNIWVGVTAENQTMVDRRVPSLMRIRGPVRFVSIEPQLGRIDLRHIAAPNGAWIDALGGDVWTPDRTQIYAGAPATVNWVITGGESGPKHRPIDPAWVTYLRDQCLETRVAFFHKQWGGLTPKSGGRLLEGRTWSQYPNGEGGIVEIAEPATTAA